MVSAYVTEDVLAELPLELREELPIGGNARDSFADNEGVNVVGSLIGFNGFEIA